MSKKELSNQLKHDKFPKKAIEYAVKNVEVDYKENALSKAETYMDTFAMSKEELKRQLKHDGFNDEEVKYALKNIK